MAAQEVEGCGNCRVDGGLTGGGVIVGDGNENSDPGEVGGEFEIVDCVKGGRKGETERDGLIVGSREEDLDDDDDDDDNDDDDDDDNRDREFARKD